VSPKLRLSLLLSLPLGGFLVLLWFLWQGLDNDPTLLPSALIDRPLPAFRAATLADPQRFVTPDELRGEIALFNVWATWCPTCEAEHDMLRQLAAQGVIIYGLNYKDQRELALRWLATLGNPYRFNISDEAGQIGIDLGVYGAPETFLLDANGVIRYRHVGALDERIWQEDFVPRIRQLQEQSG
jgi:cytochrome c biogenesis protein CcmG/thiol:disulfide interchange protein DsbE